MSEWVTKPLGEIVTFQKGRKVETSPYPLDGYREYLGAGKLSNSFDGYASTFLAVIAEESDVLMLWDGERSGLCRTELSGVVSSTVSKLTPKDSIDSLLLYYLLLQRYGWIQHRRTGTGVPHVPKDLGRILYLSYPWNKDEQKKIAHILQTIDRAIEKTEALIDKYQQIKAGLMHDLFTRGIGSDGQLRPCREQSPELYQETPIGWIPRGWVFASFGSKIDVIDPNPSHRYPDSVDYGCPICSTENFLGADSFSVDTAKTVPESTFLLQNARCQFTPDDVIFARKGKIGLARRYGNDKKVFSHTVVVMKPLGNEVNARWLLWLARSNWLISGIEKTMNTNLGVPTLGVEFIKKIPVPFPSLEEQKAADGALQTITDKLGAVEKELKKLKEKKSGLMHDLLTGAVSVSVEPKEEHAVETV